MSFFFLYVVGSFVFDYFFLFKFKSIEKPDVFLPYTFIYISFGDIYNNDPSLFSNVFCTLQWKILAATSAILLEISSVLGPSKNLGSEDIA